MLISLRGTNGSAKSTVIRGLMDMAAYRPIYGSLGPRMPEAYKMLLPKCKIDTFILGPYQTQCGGCDRLQYDQIIALIEKYIEMGHVIFEGVIMASVYGRVGTLMEKYKKDSVFIFLDTPLETCLQRIEARRGRPRDDRLVHNVKAKYDTVIRIRERVRKDGIMTEHLVSSEKAAKLIAKILSDG